MKFSKNISAAYLTIALVIFTALTTYAQPGGGGDPLPCDPDDATCPLDTWVLLLAATALILTVTHLYRKQKIIS